jgi:hypothetical protein
LVSDVGSPEVLEKLKAGDVAPSDGFIKDDLDVDEWNGGDELVVEGLVSLLVDNAVDILADKVLVVDFSNSGTSEASWMVRLD